MSNNTTRADEAAIVIEQRSDSSSRSDTITVYPVYSVSPHTICWPLNAEMENLTCEEKLYLNHYRRRCARGTPTQQYGNEHDIGQVGIARDRSPMELYDERLNTVRTAVCRGRGIQPS